MIIIFLSLVTIIVNSHYMGNNCILTISNIGLQID